MAVSCVGIWTPWWMATKRAGEGYTARNGGEEQSRSPAAFDDLALLSESRV